MVNNQHNQNGFILIQCPVCSSEISNQAAACPCCGHPIALKNGSHYGRKGRKYEAWGTAMVVVGLLFGITFMMLGSVFVGTVFSLIFWLGLGVFIVGRFK